MVHIAIGAHTVIESIQAGKHRGPSGGAEAGGRVGSTEIDSIVGQLIKRGRLANGIAVTAQGVGAHLVNADPQYIQLPVI